MFRVNSFVLFASAASAADEFKVEPAELASESRELPALEATGSLWLTKVVELDESRPAARSSTASGANKGRRQSISSFWPLRLLRLLLSPLLLLKLLSASECLLAVSLAVAVSSSLVQSAGCKSRAFQPVQSKLFGLNLSVSLV